MFIPHYMEHVGNLCSPCLLREQSKMQIYNCQPHNTIMCTYKLTFIYALLYTYHLKVNSFAILVEFTTFTAAVCCYRYVLIK